MTYIETVLWRSLRKIYGKMTGFQKSAVIVEETDPLKASDAIYTLLDSKRPCMIARFGATEMACILNYLSIRQGKPLLKKYLRVNPAKRNVMVVKNEMRLLKQKRNVLQI